MTSPPPYHHRVRLPAGSEPAVATGTFVEPGDVLARTTRPGADLRVPLARRLRRGRAEVEALLLVTPGARVRAGQPLAGTPQRDVRVPADALYLGYDPARGSAHLLTLEPDAPVESDVRGIVTRVEDRAVTVAVSAVMLSAAGGSGPPVHGLLSIMVPTPDAALEPASIDAEAAGRVLVAGSWASGEAITRARAVGVAGIVVGGLHARDLADFARLQHRRSLLGTAAPPFAILALDGFGPASMDPARFAWLQAQDGKRATVLGDARRLLVHDAEPAPTRMARPVVGDRVVVAAGPGRGQAGLLSEIPTQPRALGSGISALCGMIRLDGGRTVTVALANLEASTTLS